MLDSWTLYLGKDDRIYPVPKYRMSSFPKGSVLYNLHQAKETAYKNGIIIVEGQLDVARLNTYGFTNAVCTLGTSLTAQQAALLYRHCFGVVFLIEEGEPALKGVVRSIKYLKVGMQVAIAKLPSGDADSNIKEIVTTTLNNKQILNPEDIEGICSGVKQI